MSFFLLSVPKLILNGLNRKSYIYLIIMFPCLVAIRCGLFPAVSRMRFHHLQYIYMRTCRVYAVIEQSICGFILQYICLELSQKWSSLCFHYKKGSAVQLGSVAAKDVILQRTKMCLIYQSEKIGTYVLCTIQTLEHSCFCNIF